MPPKPTGLSHLQPRRAYFLPGLPRQRAIINVHIKDLNPVRCADVSIDSYNELGKESKSSYLLLRSYVVFRFSFFREAPMDWKLVLVTNFDDAQLLCTVKNIE